MRLKKSANARNRTLCTVSALQTESTKPVLFRQKVQNLCFSDRKYKTMIESGCASGKSRCFCWRAEVWVMKMTEACARLGSNGACALFYLSAFSLAYLNTLVNMAISHTASAGAWRVQLA
eukprot:3580144-Pleurochrysis_carterae.AAC.2